MREAQPGVCTTPVLPGPKQKQLQMGGQSLPEFPFTSHTDPLLQEQPSAGSGTWNVLPTPGDFPGECTTCLGGQALGAVLTEHDLMAL